MSHTLCLFIGVTNFLQTMLQTFFGVSNWATYTQHWQPWVYILHTSPW